MEYLTHFSEMIAMRGLTDSTRKSYLTYISSYLNYVSDVLSKTPENVSWDEMREFLWWIQSDRGISDRTMNYVIAQLRFFTLYVLHRPWDPYQIPYRKFDKYMPFVPTRAEVKSLISAIHDHKAKAMVILLYSAGLRIGEVCSLRYEDISRRSMRIHIARGKNRQDRYALLSPVALKVLTNYWRMYGGASRDYIFRNRSDPSKHVSTSFVSNHIHKAEDELGWPRRFTAHTMRHAFATHFYEDNGDILVLKELLGHKSLSSTTIYVTLSNRILSKYSSPIESLHLFEVHHER